jgi:hypothetical protein
MRACMYIYSSLHVSRVPTCDGLHYTISAGARSNGGKAEDALRGRPTPLTQGLAAVAVSPKCVTGPARRTQGTSSTPWVAPPASRARVRTPLHAVTLCGLGVGVRRPYVERYECGRPCGHHASACWQGPPNFWLRANCVYMYVCVCVCVCGIVCLNRFSCLVCPGCGRAGTGCAVKFRSLACNAVR